MWLFFGKGQLGGASRWSVCEVEKELATAMLVISRRRGCFILSIDQATGTGSVGLGLSPPPLLDLVTHSLLSHQELPEMAPTAFEAQHPWQLRMKITPQSQWDLGNRLRVRL